MNEQQFDLMMRYLTRYFNEEEIEELFENHPLTGFGDNGQLSIRRMLSELSIEYFAKAYISDEFSQDFGDYAKEILSTLKGDIESDKQENTAVIAPRSHGKSTISSLAIPTWSACHNKKKFVLFISANADTAANFLSKVKRALESPEIIEDFGKMKDKKRTWNNEEIETTTGTWISCSGWKSGLRGMNKPSVGRPDLIILDDLEDKETLASESLQSKLELAFNEEIGRLGAYNTDFFYIGTLLSQDSLLARVIKMPSWKVLFYKRVISFPEDETLWEEWKQIYRDMDNPNRLDDAYSFFLSNKKEMTKGAKVLWDDKVPMSETKYKHPYYHVMLDREKWGESSFWKEDQNEPRSSEDYIFQTLHYWESLPSFDDMDIVLGLDPSMGKKNSDFQALVVMGKHKQTGRKYIVDSLLLRIKPTELLTTIIDLCKKYPITQIGVESTAFQEYLADDLKQKLKEAEMYHVILTKKKPRQNKHSRIENLEPFISTGEILFNKDCSEFNTHVMSYSKRAKNDDGADCVQLTFELVEKRRRKSRIIDKPSFL
ncbi:phage terminase large subunit [Oceanobacillus caeni]|uniref:phage terminase large subunit n=1 Tax=Virgibacillus sp. SK37 TaxID=403957 RepID=UPI0011A69629|nr:phage terminase large subunit [Virgibacillus sp. SK37]